VPQNFFKFLFNLYNRFYQGIKYRFLRFRSLSLRRRRAEVEKKIILNVLEKRRFPKLSQLSYLPRFLTKGEKIALVFFSFFAVASLFGIFASLYFDNTKLSPALGGEYTEGIVGYPRFINPLYGPNNEVDKDLILLVYSGLTKRNSRGAIVLDAAKSYKADDEKIYTFTIKDNIYWHDGKKLTADDVVFTIKSIQDKNYNSPLRASWSDITVQKIDDYTAQFKLSKASGAFLSLLTTGILPKHIWEKVPVANINLAESNNKPVGSGHYKFKSFVKDKLGVIKSYQLEANKSYYDAKPYIEKLNLKFFPDYTSAVNALDSRQIDGLAFVPSEARSALKLKSRLDSYGAALPQYNAIFFNGNQNTILKDKSVRKALTLGIDRKKIVKEALEGDGEVIDGPILPGFLSDDGKSALNLYDKEAAQKLLTDAGWLLKDGEKYRAKKKDKLKIVLMTIEKSQNVKVAGIIKSNWEEIGAEAELKIVSAATIAKDYIYNRKFEALLFGEMYSPDLDPHSYWHSSAAKYPGLNLAQYSNSKADALLDAARKSSDKEVRQKKYQEFQAILAEDFAAIFLWQPKYTYYVDKKVQGMQISNIVTPSDRFYNLFGAYINTRRILK